MSTHTAMQALDQSYTSRETLDRERRMRQGILKLHIGSLKGKRIPYFRAPVPGLPMVHWNGA